MLFIKNYCTDLEDGTIEINFKEGKEKLSLELVTPKATVELFNSEDVKLIPSIKKSIKRINKVNNLASNTSAKLIKNTFTELSYYSTDNDMKVVINSIVNDSGKEYYQIPVSLGCINSEEFKKPDTKRYPKDMIILIVPDDTKDEHYKCVCDNRNLKAPISSVHVNDVDGKMVFKLILLIPKYPIWATLKYPAYFYLSRINGENVENLDAHKFGTSLSGKIKHNTLVSVDIKEAVDYIEESKNAQQKYREEKGGERMNKVNSSDKKFAPKQNKPYEKPNTGFNKGKKSFNSAPANKANNNHRSHGKIGR